MKRLSAFLTIFLVFISFSHAEGNGKLFFHHLDRRDGLSNLSVSSVVQDQRGFIWFGTQNGLNRYDGRNIELFTHDPYNRNSLPHNKIQTMNVSGSYLLIGTYGGLSIFNPDSGEFRNFKKTPGDINSLSDNVIVSVIPDNNGKLWIGTLSGLNYLDPETGENRRFLHKENDSSSIADNVIRTLFLDSAGDLWIGTYNGLDRYSKSQDRFYHYGLDGKEGHTLPSKYVMSIADGGNGTLWLGTWDGGISRFDTVTGEVKTYTLEDNRVYTVYAAPSGLVWAGTWGGGLFILDPGTGRTERYVNQVGNLTSISHDIVYAIHLDDAGLYWIGTNGGGVNITSPDKRSDLVLYHDANDPSSLAKGAVYSMVQDSSGDIWIGLYGGGLDRWNSKTDNLVHYTEKNGSGLPYDTVTTLYITSSGKLLAGTLKGLAYYEPGSDKFKPCFDLKKDEHVYALFEDSGKNLWVGTYDNGLYLLDSTGTEIQHFYSDLEKPGTLSSNLITSFVEYNGSVWIGTNEGLNVFDRKRGTFSAYFLNPDDSSSLSSNSIRTMFVDSRNRLWIGTEGGGLNLYNADKGTFIHYLKQDGFSDDSVTGILEDDLERIWCATKNGITILNPDTGRMMILTEYDGLPDSNLNYGILKDSAGYLYFTSSKGISRFSQKVSRFNSHKPPVYITSVSGVEGPLINPFSFSRDSVLELPDHQNTISFEFIGLDFTAPLKNSYMYKLDGFDPEWVDSGGEITVRYSNLDPGTYTFHVKAANNDGIWGEKEDSITFRVVPTFWKSFYAQIIYDLLLILAVFAVIKIRDHYILKKKVKELELLKKELTNTNEELKALSVQDPLTGLYNRREMDERLDLEVVRSRRFKEPLTVFMIDIDYFKDYNDRYGHKAGDECLVTVAEVLKKCLVRTSDFIARYGGDEFIVVLPRYGIAEAEKMAEKIKREVQKKRIKHLKTGIGGIVTVTIGVAAGTAMDNDTSETFIKTADKALYKAKRHGRNRVISLPLHK